MKRNGISFFAFGWMLLLVVSKSLAAPNPAVLDDILKSVKNIENLIKLKTADASIHVPTTTNRRDQASPPVHPLAHLTPPITVNFKDLQEWWKPSSRRVNTDYRRNHMPRTSVEHDYDMYPVRPHLTHGRSRKGLKTNGKIFFDDERSDEQINSNGNSNNNLNSNSMKLGPDQHSTSGLISKTGRSLYGGRSLSRHHDHDSHRNVNSNTNVNTNSNTNNANANPDITATPDMISRRSAEDDSDYDD